MPRTRDPEFTEEALRIKEMLQSVEDVLIHNGYDEIVAATEHGIFAWRTIERARELIGEPSEDAE